MSIPVTLGNFATTAPPAGSIRVLYKTQGGVDNIRAITISNVDLDGNDISLSLDAIEVLKVFLGGSHIPTREKLTVLTRASHPRAGNISFYYLDVDDLFLSVAGNTISGSASSIINIQPYLTEPFFNNDYNALISNAEITRPSTKRYDVDRVSGYVYPSNFNAIAGIGKLDFTDLKYDGTGGVRTLEETIQGGAPLSSYNISGSTTSFASVLNDQDIDVRVGRNDITNAIGSVPSRLIDNFPSHFYSNPNAYIVVESKLIIEIDSGSVFNTSGGKYQSAVLAQQTSSLSGNNSSAEHETTIYPFSATIASGSMNSGSLNGDLFVRFKQENKVLSNGGIYVSHNNEANVEYTLKSFLFATPNTENNLPVSLYYSNQIPYAPFAPVQDSNYTHTGHTNARYNGTKTSENDFSGIGAAVAATQFTGATYLNTEDNNFICSQSLSDRKIEDFLFEGTDNFPNTGSFALGTVFGSNAIVASNDKSVAVEIAKGETVIVGDVLLFKNGSNTEVMQVLSSQEFGTLQNGSVLVTLTVTRNYDGAGVQAGFAAGSTVTLLHGTRIFQPKGNRLIPVGRHKIWVKETRNIVETNERGFVTAVSISCTV